MDVKEAGLMLLLIMLLPKDLLLKINIHIEEKIKNVNILMDLIRLINIKDSREGQAFKLL